MIKLGQCGCSCQMARFTSSPAGTCTLFMMPSVPASTCVAQPGRHDAQPHQDAPLQVGGRQFLRVTQQEPGDNSNDSGAKIEPGKRVVLWHRARFHQAFITHHTNSKTDIGKLHKHQARPEVIADFVVTDNRCANHRQ